MDFDYEIQHFNDLEDVSREELKWEEEQARCEARLQLLKRWKLLQVRFEEEKKKAQRLEVLTATAFARRVETIVANEEATRCEIAQNEHIMLEGVLRFLDKRIREDILSAAYTIQQRLKYLNKTMDMVLKKEGHHRRTISGAERYAWLVMAQKFDAQSTKFLRREVIEKVRREKQIKHDKLRRITGTAEWQNVEPALENSFGNSQPELSCSTSSQLQPRPPRKPRTTRKKKIISYLVSNDFQQIREQLIAREEQQRGVLDSEMFNAFQIIVQLRNHLTTRDAESHLPQTQEEVDAKFARRGQLLIKQEQRERIAIEESHQSTWTGVERRLKRAKLGEAKVTECVQMRQLTHDAKLQSRYQRIAHQQQAFAERERAAVADLAAIRQEPPAPIQSMTIQPPGNSRARQQLVKDEESDRKLIVQEQTTFMHMIYGNMLKDECDGDIVEAKERAARSRRDRGERMAHESRIKEIEQSNDKHSSALDIRRADKRLKLDVERVVREEQASRVKINLEALDLSQAIHAQLKSLSRMAGVLQTVADDERRKRISIKSTEKHGRASLLAFVQSRTRPQIRLPAPPLPPPPIKFEAARRMYTAFSASNAQGRSAKFSAPESKSSRLPQLATRYTIASRTPSAPTSPRHQIPNESSLNMTESSRGVSPNLLLEVESEGM